jgi:hypothetical protein
MSQEYPEDNLLEKTAMELFFQRLGWNTAGSQYKVLAGKDMARN